MRNLVRLSLFLALALPRAAAAQGLVVAPHAIYVDHRTRSAFLMLYNPGSEAVEASVSFLFGYPVTDTSGHLTLFEPDSVTAEMPAAHQWLEAFPKRVSIPPLTRQTVRLLARPPQGLADGEYWARVVVTAKGGSIPVTNADTSNIRIGLNLEVRSILPLIYRKGPVRTGLAIASISTSTAADSLVARPQLRREGTAAYTGTARGSLVNAKGQSLATFSEPIAVYYNAEPAFRIPVKGLPPGSYRLRLEFATERPDIAPELLLRAPVLKDSVEVTLP